MFIVHINMQMRAHAIEQNFIKTKLFTLMPFILEDSTYHKPPELLIFL